MTEKQTPQSFKRNIGVMKVYLCGGTGINVAAHIKKMLEEQATITNIAKVEIVLVDTSDSNLSSVNNGDAVYLFKDKDGGGKKRRAVYEFASPKAFEILEKFPAGDLNIVVSSLGGASGSVIAPCLMRELIKQKKLVMAVGITSTDSLIEIENTVASLASYELLSEKQDSAVVLAPFHNDNAANHGIVNDLVANLIMMLAVLGSRQNAGLDTADLTNWLHFDRVSNVGPRLMGLMHATSSTKINDDIHPVTVATLAVVGSEVRPSWIPDYQAVGYMPNAHELIQAPVHFVIADGVVQLVHNKIAVDAEALKRKAAGRTLSKRLTTSSSGDDDMVF